MHRTARYMIGAVVGLTFGLASAVASATSVTAGGSTFIYPVLSEWAQTYAKNTGVQVNYQSIGSGGGLRQLEEKTVTFAASDMPLKEAKLKSSGYVQWPMILGGIVPVVNLTGVKPGDMTLDGDTLAKIYMGKITKWNDPAIKALNPNLNLPDGIITVVHRSDGSGTTFNFTNYLDKVSPEWDKDVGSSTEVNWPTGIGGKGNAGVAQYVRQVPNAIGYVEYAYAKDSNLTWTKLKNKAGTIVSPNSESFAAAAQNADYADAPGYYLILTNQPGDKSWPILATTFVLMYAEPQNKTSTVAALKFMDWAYKNGGEAATKLDYIPIPASVYNAVETTWKNDIKVDGAAVWPAQ